MLGRSWSVTTLVRKPDSPQAQALSRMGAKLATGNVTVRESMRSAMSGAEIVVHNAGRYELGVDRLERQRLREVNVEGTRNVLYLAQELGIPRTVYVSTVQAFGETGPQSRDETFTRRVACRSAYEQSKTDAHEVALQYQQRGLPLIIVCPHAVVGANDHSAFGYFIRLYVNRVLPPLGWSPNSIFCCVALKDLVDGIGLTSERGRLGETYFLCGEPLSLHEIFDCWRMKPGGFAPRLWLPAGLVAALFAPLEPLQRRLGLPAFLSRETVWAGATNWFFSSEKAKTELGWNPCCAEATWSTAVDDEIQLLARRRSQSLLQRLKPLENVA